MSFFGIGDDPTIPRAEMEGEFRTGFRRGQEFGFSELESARATGEEQRRLAEALRAQAEGRAPSLAAMQYARALEQSQAAAASQLASARGLSPAAAQRMLMAQQTAARQAAAGKSAELRLQEQQAAQAMLGTALMQQRQQALLGGQVAGQMGAQSAEIGISAQRIEQERLLRQQQMQMEEEEAIKKGIAGGIGGLAGGAAGFFLSGGNPLGAVVGAGLGANLATGGGRAASEAELKALTPKSKGGEIKGKAAYGGDTRSNDTVPALLSPGEIVLPRSVAQDEEAPEKAKKFVEAIKGKKKPTPKDYIAALSRLSELESRLNAIETLMDLEAEAEG